MLTEFRTEEFPPSERFGRWHDSVRQAVLPLVLRSDHQGDFRAGARVLGLGEMRISALTHPPLEALRTSELLRRGPADHHQIMVDIRGHHRFAQGRREAVIGPGDLLVFDASRIWHGWARGDGRPLRCVMVTFPQALLPIAPEQVLRLAAVRLPGQAGIGAVLSGYLRKLITHADQYRAADTARLAIVTTELVTAWCAHHLGAAASVQPETNRQVLRTRVHAYIEDRLGDPGLTPPTVAAAHHISLRHLHQLFHEQGMTVAGRIRQRRLECCFRDLAEPRLLARPIHAVAARWGFADAAHFSRLFRAAYGISPSDYRDLVRRDREARASTR